MPCSLSHFHFPVDKTVKLWKINDKSNFEVVDNNLYSYHTNYLMQGKLPTEDLDDPTEFKLPKLAFQGKTTTPQLKRTFSNAHAYHIHSISVSSDRDTFLSADDLRINVWNLNDASWSFSNCILKFRTF